MTGCPGRDRSSWTHDDIFDVTCRGCGEQVEFFKDEKRRLCPSCGACIVNPKQVQSCADWCSSADNCSLFRDAVTGAAGAGAPAPAAVAAARARKPDPATGS